jgi:hypothetical protein
MAGLTFNNGRNAAAMTSSSTLNVGIGTTISSWNSVFTALEIGRVGDGIFSGSGGGPIFTSNAYYGSQWTYARTGAAANYDLSSGSHKWYVAGSGTAGGTVTFTQAMTLTNGGNLSIGTTTSVGMLNIYSNVQNSASSLSTAYSNSVFRIGTYNTSGQGISVGNIGGYTQYIQSQYSDGATTNPLSINPYGGNVGIGTSSPLTLLDVKQSATGGPTVNTAFRDSSTNGNALQIWNGNGEARLRAVYYGTPSDQNITFYTVTSGGSEAERMRITANGQLSFTNVPINNYQIDSSVLISVANGGTINFNNYSGMVIVNNTSNGVCAMWLCGAGYTVLLGQSTSGATGTLSYNGSIGGYTWTSNYGSTANYGVFAVKTRNGA